MAVVKANGYGHGLLTAASALKHATQVGLNSLDEVHQLRAAGFNLPANLFAPLITSKVLAYCANNQVRPAVFDHEHLKILAQMPKTGSLEVWLKVDTGMGRLGFAPSEVAEVLDQLKAIDAVDKIHLMSHLAQADSPDNKGNDTQLSTFQSFDALPGIEDRSLLNSAGVVSFSEQAYDWVRPGIMLYGISPTNGVSAAELGLVPAMTLYSRLISVKEVPKGHPIGYSGTFCAPEAMKVGIIAAGYGDGYPRLAPTGTPVWINDQIVPSIGRVSMDMLAVDLRSMPNAKVGDVAQLWGANNPIEGVAQSVGTIAYELTCRVLERVEHQVI